MTTPLTVIAITTAAPGQEQKLRAAQEQLVAETVLEPGCLRYELHQSIDNPSILLFVETWASQEALATHFQSPAIKRFQAEAGNLIADFKMHRLQLVTDGKR